MFSLRQIIDRYHISLHSNNILGGAKLVTAHLNSLEKQHQVSQCTMLKS